MTEILTLQGLESDKDVELLAGSSFSINCKVISTLSIAVC